MSDPGSAGTGGTGGAADPGGAPGTGPGASDPVATPSAEVVLTLTPPDAALAKGTWRQYTAVAVHADGSKSDVTATATWSSSDPSIAAVDATGRVTGLAVGSALVSAAAAGASAAVPVTVIGAVLEAISLTPVDAAVPLAVDQVFTATGIFSDLSQQDLTAQVTWSSSAPAVATVSAGGLAHPLSVGSTTILASLGGVSASTSLQVTDATVLAVDVEPAVASVAAGFSLAFDAVATFSDYTSLDVTALATWTSDSAAATLSGAPGVASGVAAGTANVTASFGGLAGSASLTVTSAVLQALAIAPSPISTPAGLTVQLAATGSFSDGSTQDLTSSVAWSSSDAAVAFVSNAAGSTGLLSATSGGSATVTATLDGISATAPLTVTGAAITSIEVRAASPQLPVGYRLQLAAVASFDDGSSLDVTPLATWASSDAGVAAVYTSSALAGLVSGVAPGAAVVEAALGGHTGSVALTVTSARLRALVVAPDPVTLAPRATRQLTATGEFDDGSSLDLTRQCSWRSQAKAVASVTKGGLVTGLGFGDASVLARKGHVSDTAAVHVR